MSILDQAVSTAKKWDETRRAREADAHDEKVVASLAMLRDLSGDSQVDVGGGVIVPEVKSGLTGLTVKNHEGMRYLVDESLTLVVVGRPKISAEYRSDKHDGYMPAWGGAQLYAELECKDCGGSAFMILRNHWLNLIHHSNASDESVRSLYGEKTSFGSKIAFGTYNQVFQRRALVDAVARVVKDPVCEHCQFHVEVCGTCGQVI